MHVLTHRKVIILIICIVLVTGILGFAYKKFSIKNNASCIQVVVTARNPNTGEAEIFGNPCIVPKGWTGISPYVSSSTQTQSTTTSRNDLGILSGKVTIGPNCPVERVDQPCPTPPEAYARVLISVYKTDGTTLVKSVHPDSSGEYTTNLAPGNYLVSHSGLGIGFKHSPVPVTIKTITVTEQDFDIDTGIR